jgi:hypothetical protein
MAHPNLEVLSLQEEQNEGFSFDFEDEGNENGDLQWCLIGKFLCERVIHFNSESENDRPLEVGDGCHDKGSKGWNFSFSLCSSS